MAFNALDSANLMRKAMKGLGTDDKSLISAIVTLTNEQLQEVRKSFERDLKRDLLADIKSETSGDYERALVGLVHTRPEFEAKELRRAVKGVGTDEDVFVQILCHRTPTEIAAIKDAYLAMYGKTLERDINGDFSGDGKKFALALVNTDTPVIDDPNPADLDDWVVRLYNAGQGRLGTDESTFLEAICGHGPNWLRVVNEAYGRKYGHTLVSAVKKEFSGFAAKGLAAKIKDHDDYYAELIYEACEGVGTDEGTLIRVLVGRRHCLAPINNRFMAKYNKSIAHRLKSEVSFNLGRVLLAIAGDN